MRDRRLREFVASKPFVCNWGCLEEDAASEVRWRPPGKGGAFFSTRYAVWSVFGGRVL